MHRGDVKLCLILNCAAKIRQQSSHPLTLENGAADMRVHVPRPWQSRQSETSGIFIARYCKWPCFGCTKTTLQDGRLTSKLVEF